MRGRKAVAEHSPESRPLEAGQRRVSRQPTLSKARSRAEQPRIPPSSSMCPRAVSGCPHPQAGHMQTMVRCSQNPQGATHARFRSPGGGRVPAALYFQAWLYCGYTRSHPHGLILRGRTRGPENCCVLHVAPDPPARPWGSSLFVWSWGQGIPTITRFLQMGCVEAARRQEAGLGHVRHMW